MVERCSLNISQRLNQSVLMSCESIGVWPGNMGLKGLMMFLTMIEWGKTGKMQKFAHLTPLHYVGPNCVFSSERPGFIDLRRPPGYISS